MSVDLDPPGEVAREVLPPVVYLREDPTKAAQMPADIGLELADAKGVQFRLKHQE